MFHFYATAIYSTLHLQWAIDPCSDYQRTCPFVLSTEHRTIYLVTNHISTDFVGKRKRSLFIAIVTRDEEFHHLCSQDPFETKQSLKKWLPECQYELEWEDSEVPVMLMIMTDDDKPIDQFTIKK